MRALPLLAAFALTLAGISPAHAQDATPASATGAATARPDGFFRCELPGGTYLVALRNLQSVSTHEYAVDGAARVTEVTVATASSVEARFYYLEPLAVNGASSTAATLQGLQQRAQTYAQSRAPVEPVWEKVAKSYPATTHAHTVEYRLASKQNVQQLYTALEQAWVNNKGANFKTE